MKGTCAQCGKDFQVQGGKLVRHGFERADLAECGTPCDGSGSVPTQTYEDSKPVVVAKGFPHRPTGTDSVIYRERHVGMSGASRCDVWTAEGWRQIPWKLLGTLHGTEKIRFDRGDATKVARLPQAGFDPFTGSLVPFSLRTSR